jgi:hypothetical protein
MYGEKRDAYRIFVGKPDGKAFCMNISKEDTF